MPVFALMSFAPCEAALKSLSERVQGVVNTSDTLKRKVDNLANSENFPADRDDVVESTRNLLNIMNEDFASQFSAVGNMMREIAYVVFEGYMNTEYPVTHESLSNVKGNLPDNMLEQFRYMDIRGYSSAVHQCTSLSSLINIHPRDLMFTAPEDMYVVSVLTRTTVLMQELRANDDMDEWARSAFSVVGELAETVGLLRQSLMAMIDALESSELNDAAVRAIGDADIDAALKTSISAMSDTVDRVTRTGSEAKILLSEFYPELLDCFADSQKAIQTAYKMFVDQNMITF